MTDEILSITDPAAMQPLDNEVEVGFPLLDMIETYLNLFRFQISPNGDYILRYRKTTQEPRLEDGETVFDLPVITFPLFAIIHRATDPKREYPYTITFGTVANMVMGANSLLEAILNVISTFLFLQEGNHLEA